MYRGNKIVLLDRSGREIKSFVKFFKLLKIFACGFLIKFKGKNSTVVLKEPFAKFSKTKISLRNNSYVKIDSSRDIIKKLKISMADNQKCTIGKDFFTWSTEIVFSAGDGFEVNIGNNCMFSKNILIRTSDGHTIYDTNTGEILNHGKSIDIGDNVWLAGNVSVLKGSNIANDCVIGHGSIVVKPCETPNSVYAGVPAKLIKTNINWRREEPDRKNMRPFEDKQKIDIVYLWCDLSDDNFRKKKEECAKKYGAEYNADNNCRYINNDELKYSLRSLEKYAPWINNVFIVTDEQVPKWLNLENPKIRLVNQNNILPDSALPTFNSNAIEHCIVNIPELSENFLYANDDMFFNDYVEPEFFFDNNKVIVRYTRAISEHNKSIYALSIKNAKKLILKRFFKDINFSSHHNIDAYKKSDIISCQKEFKEEISNTINSHFRSSDNIHRIIYLDYSVAVNNGIFKQIDKKSLFHIKKDVVTLFSQSRKKEQKLKKYKPKLFCINDTEETTDENRRETREFLEKMFPEKSGFEK